MTDEPEVELTAEDMAVINEINEERSNDDEKPVVNDTDTTTDVEEADDSTEPTEFTDEHSAQAQAYGLDVKQFETPAQLERKILDIDRRWAEHAAMQRWQQQQQQFLQQQQVPQQQPQQPGQPATPPADVPFKLNLNTDEYPPELIEQVNTAFKAVHEHYQPLQQQVQQLQQFVEQQRQQMEQAKQAEIFAEFHRSVQGLNHKQLFGETPESLSQEQALNIRKLYDHASMLAEGYAVRNMPVPPMSELVRRAEKLAFEKELDQYRAQTRNARIAKQAQQRLGSGRRSTSFQSQGKWDGDDVDNPVLKEAWDRMIAERGER